MPEVSVIIPTYNRAGFIGAAIESVLAQTYTDYEIIVVDDGSTDNTPQVLQAYAERILYIRQANQKLPAARNAGVLHSKGTYLVFLDDDDLLLPDKLAIQTAALNQNNEIGLVAGGYQDIDSLGQVISTTKTWELRKNGISLASILLAGLGPPNVVMLRRKWFDTVGGFRDWPYCEDMDLWYRLAHAGCPMAWVPALAAQYRQHDDSMTVKIEQHTTAAIAVVEDFYKRNDLPLEILELRVSIIANKLLTKAGRYFARGDFRAGRSAIAESITYSPALLSGSFNQLVDSIVAWRNIPNVKTVCISVDLILDNWPESHILTNKQCNQLRGQWRKAAFYDAYTESDITSVAARWFDVVIHGPKWLLNRGAWSLLMKSLTVRRNSNH